MTGLVVLGAAAAVACALGVIRRLRDGRLREARAPGGSQDGHSGAEQGAALLAELGVTPGAQDVTLVQFSSAFCQPCVATRRVLDQVAAMVEGVTHVEVDAESHLGLVRRLGILRTPTVLILDRGGRETKRATGTPRKADIIAAVGAIITVG